MTADELLQHFRDTYGFKPWPSIYEVDHETYANVCQEVFNQKLQNYNDTLRLGFYAVGLGPNAGLYFKGVELILVKAQ